MCAQTVHMYVCTRVSLMVELLTTETAKAVCYHVVTKPARYLSVLKSIDYCIPNTSDKS